MFIFGRKEKVSEKEKNRGLSQSWIHEKEGEDCPHDRERRNHLPNVGQTHRTVQSPSSMETEYGSGEFQIEKAKKHPGLGPEN